MARFEEPSHIYDIAVIGGGIAGAGIARDAALRGLDVILFEKNTFGCGTSSKSSRLIHGGIRYLELSWNALVSGNIHEAWKNLCFVFSSLRESRVLQKIAPNLVTPHPILIPIYVGNKRRRFTVFAGCFVYYLLALLSGGGKKPKIFWSPRSALNLIPELDPKNLNGAILIWDCVTNDANLVKATLASASAKGARCLENSNVESYEYQLDKNAYSIEITGRPERVLARKIINASGPWVDQVRHSSRDIDEDYILPVAGSHVWVKSFLPYSVLLEGIDGRLFFVINFDDKARIGTTERIVKSPEAQPTQEEINYLLESVSRYFPEKRLSLSDVLSADSGVRPLPLSVNNLNPHQISREHEIRVSAAGVVHMIGVKLTDHRRAAEKAINRLIPSLLPFNPKARRKTLTHKTSLVEISSRTA